MAGGGAVRSASHPRKRAYGCECDTIGQAEHVAGQTEVGGLSGLPAAWKNGYCGCACVCMVQLCRPSDREGHRDTEVNRDRSFEW